MHSIKHYKILMLRPTDIRIGPTVLRRDFDAQELSRLADSVAASGILEPLSVRKNTAGQFELIAGARRLRAAKMAGLRRVPCVLHEADDVTAMLYGILENTHRTALSDDETAEGLRRLTENGRLSKTETALRLGLSPSEFGEKLCGKKQAPSPTEPVPPPEPPKHGEPVRKMALGDLRFFSNSLYKLADTVRDAGIEVKVQHRETEQYSEYKIRLDKSCQKTGVMQLKIC